MRVKNGMIDAKAEFEPDKRIIILKAGSIVSKGISSAPTFRSRAIVERKRKENTIDSVVQQDMIFHSLSTAATFVVGSNRNGWTAWRNQRGLTMAEVYKK